MLLDVGRITKPHGIRGDVIVVLTTDRTERVAPGSVLISDGGRQFEVRRSSPHQHGWIVTFDDVPDRTAAEALRGTVLRAEPIVDPDALWVHELIGSRVFEVGGVDRGRVTALQDNPASDLLVLDTGALVPVRFVVSSADGVVTIDVPDGLFDLDA